jgi:hypothetical protein
VKRVQDWCDWMAPEAWNVEHNRLHHYHLGEDKDPDLVQRNLEFLRDSQEPMYQKYATVLALMPIWKWAYYAPNSTYLYVSFAVTIIIGIRLTILHSPLLCNRSIQGTSDSKV